jgi:hypothetical protein
MVTMALRAKHPRIGERDWEIMTHVTQYRITTREVLHDLFFDDSEPNAVTKVTSRLCANNMLNRYDLFGQRSYFTFGLAAVKLLGLSPKKCQPLGPQALVREFGTLAFCFNSKPPRNRMSVSEIAKKDSSVLGKSLDSSHYYLDIHVDPATNQAIDRLAFIRVDHGSSADNLVKKCVNDVEQRLKIPSLERMIANDRFMISVVTCTEPKKDAILTATRQRSWPIRFRIEVIPDLVNLIGTF